MPVRPRRRLYLKDMPEFDRSLASKNIPEKRSWIYQHFREGIICGKLKAGARLPAQTVLARKFKVSPVTVQRSIDLLSSQGFVRTRRRGGTFVVDRPPHLFCYGLVFIDTPGDAYTWTLYHSALASEAARLYRDDGVKLSTYHGVGGHVDQADYQRLLEDVREGLLGGIIITAYPSSLLQTPLIQNPDLPRVAIMGTPQIPGIPRVFGDVAALIDMALDHFVAQGRRRIAIVTSSGMYTDCPEHYLCALKRRGLPADPAFIQIIDRRPPEAARHCVRLLMRQPVTERPDGLLILDDNLVENSCAGLIAAGVNVPEDVMVVGHCNFPCRPPASVPIKFIGFDARQTLNACIDSISRQRRGEQVEPWVRISPVLDIH